MRALKSRIIAYRKEFVCLRFGVKVIFMEIWRLDVC